jgi:hypothetical protein
MKKNLSTLIVAASAFLVCFSFFAFKSAAPDNNNGHSGYMYKQITAIESVIPGGLGRSRLITTDDNGQMIERDLKNFYSLVGINFGNISDNDRAIVERLNEYSEEGWDLVNVVSGSNQQMSNGNSGGGILFTRYIFRKAK